MIVFDLRCSRQHVFEAWFGSTDDFAAQKAAGLVECPMCSCREIDKAVMAPAVSAKGNRVVTDGERKSELARLAAIQAEVEAKCDYVGSRFATEARARHNKGEAAEGQRGLIGEATLADAVDLLSEGIAVTPLPFRPRQSADA